MIFFQSYRATRTGCDCLPSAVIAVVEDQWKPIAIMEKSCLAQHISSHSSHVCFNLMSHSESLSRHLLVVNTYFHAHNLGIINKKSDRWLLSFWHRELTIEYP
ncbi:hypothetical protein OUZ56_028418 [Daphnia magna]|uniref:Uncharacterized protein n=1 Tax=Daphnia magna TaxID=35525 RepID=A0ABR0B3Z4_9CRUS|nr:hypothetical protein OUZ56_028418 [Daphnia magna]